MSDQFIGELRLFPYNFAPRDWAMCQGQALQISSNTALFSILGTYYGGDGVRTFALPNLQGSVAIGQGQGPGLSNFALGESGGEVSVTLSNATMPAHTHGMTAIAGTASATTPDANLAPAEGHGGGRGAYTIRNYAPPGSGTSTTLAPASVGTAGSGAPHANLQPTVVMTWCIALAGIFPPRG